MRADARDYERYAEFDIYFLFNPFDDDVYEQIVTAIVRQNRECLPLEGEKFLICYGNANLDAINSIGCFSLVASGKCPYRGNQYSIFKLQISI